jgi:hypothetical protein
MALLDNSEVVALASDDAMVQMMIESSKITSGRMCG